MNKHNWTESREDFLDHIKYFCFHWNTVVNRKHYWHCNTHIPDDIIVLQNRTFVEFSFLLFFPGKSGIIIYLLWLSLYSYELIQVDLAYIIISS